MALNTTATISSDIVFQQQETEAFSLDNRQGSIGYSQALTSGTGDLEINAVYNLQSQTISPNSSYSIDFNDISQPIVGGAMPLSFTKIRSITVHNAASITGEDLSVRSTGSNAFTEPFNGASGNILVKPASTYSYSDPYTGATVNGSNKNFQVYNNGTGTGTFSVIAVGVTG